MDPRTQLALCVVEALLVCALIAAHAREARALEWVLKPLAAGVFLLTAWLADLTASRFGATLVLGLALCAVGDVALIPRTRATFLFGLVAFLLGHVAYAVAFVGRGVDLRAVLGTTLLFVGPLAAVLRWLRPRLDARMLVAVVAYAVTITAMVATAAGTVAAHGGPWLLVGAVMFYVSDLAVARDRFVEKSVTNKLWGWPLYFGGQMVLALAAARG